MSPGDAAARGRRTGIALMVGATLCFSLLDACAKWLVQGLPVIQVVWARFALHVLLMVLLLAPRHGRALVRMKSPKLQALRGLMLCTMTALNFVALQYLQLAETGAIQFSVPILIALLSAWLLHERLDARRWFESSSISLFGLKVAADLPEKRLARRLVYQSATPQCRKLRCCLPN